MIRIAGLQKLTLLDFPERVACTVFLSGCNFRCPFCHNSSLIPVNGDIDEISEDELFTFLKKRVGILDGVAITGGEPLLFEDIIPLIRKIKDLGYAVKLDTNGSFPQRLQYLVEEKLVDYVAMDIKNAPEKYALTCGMNVFDITKVQQSIRYLLGNHVPYEFRTTVVREFHEPSDFESIGKWISGAERYFIQPFVDSGACLQDGLHAPDDALLALFRGLSAKYVQNAQIRGK